MTPMYLLDNAFRILDWNEAFTIAFDRTMESRKGRGVLEWDVFPGRQDLIKLLGLDLMWSEYAISYDRVLNNTRMYPDLRERLLGGHGGIRPIPDDGRVLDLRAGTGQPHLSSDCDRPGPGGVCRR